MPVTIDGTNGITAPGVTDTGNLSVSGTSTLTGGITGTSVSLTSNVTGTLPIANGGTGATTLTANNVLLGNDTSALQAVAPGSNGNVLTSNGTTWESTALPASGSWIFIASFTANNSATVDVESTFSSAYDEYVILGSRILSSVTSGGDLQCLLKLGGTYLTSSYSSNYYVYSLNTYVQNTGATTYARLFENAATGGATQVSFEMRIHSPSSTSIRKEIDFKGTYSVTTSGPRTITGSSGHTTSTSALTGVRFYWSSGNIASGTFYLYGIKKS